MRTHLSTAVSAVLALFLASSQGDGRPVSAVDLYRSEEADRFTLSPDGAYIAFIARNVHGSRALFTQNLDTREIQSWMGGGYGPQVIDYFWISPERLAYQSLNTEGYGGLYSVKRDSPKISKLTNERSRLFLVDPLINRDSFLVARALGVSAGYQSNQNVFHQVYSEESAPGSARLAEIDPIKGKTLAELDLYLRQPNTGFPWDGANPYLFVDSAGMVQITLRNTSELNWVLTPDDEDTDPAVIGALADFRVLGLDPSGRMALVAGYFGQDRAGVYRYDLVEKSLGTMIYSDSDFDLGETARLVRDNTRQPVGLRYETDRPRTVWFSSDLQQIQGVIDKQLPERSNSIVALDSARGRFLIESVSDRQPSQIKMLDLEKRSLTTIHSSKPAIDPEAMASTQPLQITAHDGRILRGFLTRPPGLEAPYPTVVLLPRTPSIRTTWKFDPAAQFLASRGYAVLQVKTRGAPGYGNHFSSELMGDIEGIISDVEDSVNWTIGEGLVDPERVAVAGSYFGASVALSSAAAHPDLFRCAIALDGFLDLDAYQKGQMAQVDPYDSAFVTGLRKFYRDDLKSQLEALSPFAHIESVRCPVLIVYPSLPTSSFGSSRDARKMINELEDTGIQVEGFASPTHFGYWEIGVDEDERDEIEADFEGLFARIEAFLTDNL